MLHLATGQLPYNGLTTYQIMTTMGKRRPPAVPETLPAGLQQLLKQCLTFDVAARPTATQLLQVILTIVWQLAASACMYVAPLATKATRTRTSACPKGICAHLPGAYLTDWTQISVATVCVHVP